jgi:hypothetical protein
MYVTVGYVANSTGAFFKTFLEFSWQPAYPTICMYTAISQSVREAVVVDQSKDYW